MSEPNSWYVRRGKEIKGPFPTGLLSRQILLGRVRGSDEVSHDREEWRAVNRVPSLIPDVMREVLANPDDEEARERLEAARRWADERRSVRDVEDERREDEPEDLINYRRSLGERPNERRGPSRATVRAYLVVAVLVAVVVAVPFLLPSQKGGSEPDCKAPPAPGVNWSNCQMEGVHHPNVDLAGAELRNTDLSGALLRTANLAKADLAYANLALATLSGANLSGADLKGASLRSADLTNADLSGADLSYADLRNATIDQATLAGVNLSSALWIDGSECAPGSVGHCNRTAPPKSPPGM